jgi:hypothetical protein
MLTRVTGDAVPIRCHSDGDGDRDLRFNAAIWPAGRTTDQGLWRVNQSTASGLSGVR